jgi:hypothetical protein
MQQRANEYFNTAERNRDLARTLVFARLNAPSSDWAAVIAFYAALHFVHAYLYEKEGQRDPTSHHERARSVENVRALQAAEIFYDDLYDISKKVRYNPQYRINSATAQEAIDDMNGVEQVVRRGLGI